MRIAVIGGGPGGLYFALLMKKHNPVHEIRIFEQNPEGVTYGWGVVFSGRTVSYLKDSEPDSYADIRARLQTWDDLAIVHKGQKVAIGGNAYSAIARTDLLGVLKEHCLRLGVEIHFETGVTDPSHLMGYELIVGADGVHSVVREMNKEHFQTSVEFRSNPYVWYGTQQPFDALTLIFRENPDGVFVGHCYRYGPKMSTFIVECDASTWERAGFASMSDDESRAYCEDVFKDDLGGHSFLSNKSTWLNFPVVNNRRWSHGNLVLIGDALHTVHFSIGSGTRVALQDAISLHQSLVRMEGEGVEAALEGFENSRRPLTDQLLAAAHNSLTWYENVRDAMHLDPIPFAYGYMMRNARLDHEGLRKRFPEFVTAYEAYMASRP